MKCNQAHAYFVDKIRSANNACIIIGSCLLVTIVISLIGLSVTGPHKSNQPQKAVNVTKIFGKFGIPRNLWKTLISGKDDSTKIEEESNEKFSMNPYLKSKTYVRKHSGEMRTDQGRLFRGIVNWSGAAQSVVSTRPKIVYLALRTVFSFFQLT